MSGDLYYNFETLTGKTGTGADNKMMRMVSKNDQPVIRWGKTDYKTDSIYISTASSIYYLVVLCKSGGAELYFCIPLVSGSSSAELDNVIASLGTDTAEAHITINNILTDQTATVYNKKTVVLSKQATISQGQYNSLTNKKYGQDLSLTGTPATINIHNQEMDWMIDCELVGEEGTQTVPVAKGVSDLNSAAFAIIIITLAAAVIYTFVPNFMRTFHSNITLDNYAKLTRFIWFGGIVAMISITMWGFLTKKLMIACLLLFGIVAITTAGSFASNEWASKNMDINNLDYTKSLFDQVMLGLYAFSIILIVFSGTSGLKTEVEYTYYVLLSLFLVFVYVVSSFVIG